MEIAGLAGRAIMEHYGDLRSEAKVGGSPVTAADHAANGIIVDALRHEFPGDAILSEEAHDSPDRLQRERVWIVDPLDGTKEFLACNGEFAVMIGLTVAGEAVLGVVYLPDSEVSYTAIRGDGAYAHSADGRVRRLERSDAPRPPRMIGSRSHADALVERIRVNMGASAVTRSGSVGIKCIRIAEGTHDLYVHPVPYLCEWDTCAPEVIAREAGATVTDCLGGPLRYNKPDPTQPNGILVAAPGVDQAVVGLVRNAYRERGLEEAARS
jgi:3'(2'), 5'-bisphosphate nucleotidase